MARKSPVVRRLSDGSIAVYFTVVGPDGDLNAGRLTYEPGDDDFEFWASMASSYAPDRL
ncbi:hypothetical protein [Nocardia wallacei]|uniref:hypothetical protein n=1 Tax=Nocardia TaxID=1817 RepID=UPI002457F22E|nr:hypothetical protein [Nocardia wallacei]